MAAILTILIAFSAAHWLRFGWVAFSNAYLIALLTGLLLASMVLPATGAFRQEFRWAFMRKIRRLIAGWALVVMVMVGLAALLKVTSNYSRIWFGYWVLLGTAGLAFAQVLSHVWQVRQQSKSSTRRNILLVGSGEAAARVDRLLSGAPGREFNLVGRFGDQWSAQEVKPLAELADFVH